MDGNQEDTFAILPYKAKMELMQGVACTTTYIESGIYVEWINKRYDKSKD